MNKERHLQFIASFLIALILNMPFYAISVHAAINNISVKGGDGIEGFARSTDFLSFNVQASISLDTISSDQAVLGSGIQFDKCSLSINNGSECTLRFPGNGTEQFEPKSVPFTINLFKDDKSLDDKKLSTITIDNKAPQVTLSTQSKFSSQQNVVVDYEVDDFACDDSSCSSKCVGIKSIEIYTKDGAFRQAISPTANECSIKSSVTIDAKTFNDGKNSIFAKATDRFGQTSAETSVTFAVDSSAPSVVANSFDILRKGIIISAFSEAGINADVVVNISGNDLDLNSVKADLSALNPDSNLKNAKASCTSVHSTLSVCKWQIELNPKTAGSKAITINAADKSGNKENTTINKFLALDDKGPAVQSLSTATEKEGQALVKAGGNTVIAVFEEATGLSADEVFLHVGKSRIKATRCSKEAASWVCVWENVNFNPVSQMSIEADSTDVLGNSISQDSYVGVTIDNQAPVLKSINITNVGGVAPAFPGFAKIGDKISVVANLTEDNDVFAVADFSTFITDASAVAGLCERLQADEHLCTWNTNAINLESSGVITFNFSDNAGNALIVAKSFKAFGVENATVPDFWSNTVLCSPRTIDRGLGPLINQRVYCQVNLKQKSSTKSVSTVFIGAATCSGDSGIVQNVETLNAEAGSTSPFIKITLKKDDFKINKADLSCSFSIFSKIGSSTSITKNPEVENAKITLEFFNNPLGELASNVEKDIKDAKEEAEGIWKFIGTLNKLVYWAKKICGLINTIYNVVAAVYSTAYMLNIIDATTEYSFPFIESLTIKPIAIAGCKTESGIREVTQKTNTGLNWACSIVNCKQAYFWGPYVQDFINNAPGVVGKIISPGRYVGTPTKLEGDKWYSKEVKIADTKGPLSGYMRPVSEYMDPNNNIIVAGLFACLPGVIYGLDKYRQILCLHADCMKNAVGKEGLPLFACDDLKGYQTCKYLTSELFAVFPWTAVIDHFLRLIKNSLSNPLSALGPTISFLCGYLCPNPDAKTRLSLWSVCEGVKLASQIGSIANDVKNIIDEGFKVRQDYCSRIDDDDEKDDVKKTDATGKK